MDMEILSALAPTTTGVSENIYAGMPKNIVPDPGWFDGN